MAETITFGLLRAGAQTGPRRFAPTSAPFPSRPLVTLARPDGAVNRRPTETPDGPLLVPM